jgi:hypothetical protein
VDDVLVRRTRLSEGLARNGAYVSPRAEVELVERFDAGTGETLDVAYLAEVEVGSLPLPQDRIA